MDKPTITPYRTRTGIEIGKFYVPPSNMQYSHDMELLQESLLTDDVTLRREKIKNMIYASVVGIMVFLLVVVK